MDKVQEKLRTLRQNKSMHKYFEEVATELNNSGISLPVFIQDLQVDHTKESIKVIWRAVAKAKFGKESTTRLTTKEVVECFEEFNRRLADFGIHISWPQDLNFEQFLEENNNKIK